MTSLTFNTAFVAIVVALMTLLTSSARGMDVPRLDGWSGLQVHSGFRLDVTINATAHHTDNSQQCLHLCWRLKSCRGVGYSLAPGGVSCRLLASFATSEMVDDATSVLVDMRQASLQKSRLYGCDRRPCQDSEICVTVSTKSDFRCLILGIQECAQPPAVANSIVTTDGFSKAFYTCLAGFVPTSLDAVMSSTCDPQSGAWSAVSTTCVSVDCGPPPEVDNTDVQFSTTTYASTATYACVQGSNPPSRIGMEITCQANGDWSRPPSPCGTIDCGQPTPVMNGIIRFPGDPVANSIVGGSISVPAGGNRNTEFGAVVYHFCSTGYLAGADNFTSTCQPDGQWLIDPSFVCEPVDCGQPTFRDLTEVTYSTTDYLSLVNYTCVKGYEWVEGVTMSVCLPDGQWSPANLTCQPVHCLTPTLPADFTAHVSQTTFKSKALLTCTDPELIVTGETFISCLATGSWSEIQGRCVGAPCGASPVWDHTHQSRPTKRPTDDGFNIIYTCVEGYRFSNSEDEVVLTCTLDVPTWSGDTAATCQPVDCGQPPAVSNADVTTSHGLIYQSKAVYACRTGYRNATAHDTRECTAKGMWSTEVIACHERACRVVPVMANAQLTSTSQLEFDTGDVITYQCLDGLTPSNSSLSITCLEDRWGTPDFTCMAVACGEPALVQNSRREITVGANPLTPGFIVEYSCTRGFRLLDDSVFSLHCEETTQTWSGALPICVQDVCGPPPHVEKAEVTFDASTVGGTAAYTCDRGYMLSADSSSTRVCTSQGVWSQDSVVCQTIDCGEPPRVANADIDLSSFTGNHSYQSSVVYNCMANFHHSGPNNKVCNESAIWDGLVACDPNLCGDPSLEHAAFSSVDPIVGGKAVYDCLPGYQLSTGAQNEFITCESSLVWSNAIAVCGPVDCLAPPVIPNAKLSVNSTVFDSLAQYTCNHSPQMATKRCLETTTWSDDTVSCPDVQCPQPPTIEHSVSLVASRNVGDVAYYECASGFLHAWFEEKFCTEHGNWTDDWIECRIADCGQPPEVDNANATFTNTNLTSSVEYQCGPNFEMKTDKSTRVCQNDGNWSEGLIECGHHIVQSCPRPAMEPNANFTVYSVLDGGFTEYECKPGFTMASNTQSSQRLATYTCRLGVWEGAMFSCSPKDCGHPPGVDEATEIFSGTLVGSEVIYMCHLGHVLLGTSDRRQCQNDGTWSKEVIECVKESSIFCQAPPPTITNATVAYSSHQISSRAVYTCDAGYTGQGEYECEIGNTWSVVSPVTCVPVRCGVPPQMANTHVYYRSTDFGSLAVYECTHLASNTVDFATMRIWCQTDATWSEADYKCPSCLDGVPDVANAWLTSVDTFIGGRALFSCFDDHVQERTDVELARTCLESGRWSVETLACVPDPGQQVRDACDDRPPEFGTAVLNRIVFAGLQKIAVYDCNEGFDVPADPSYVFKLECGASGWEEESPECTPVDCGRPGSVVDAFVVESSGDTTYGSNITYGCDYDPFKTFSIECQANGTWSDVIAPCPRCDLNAFLDNGHLEQVNSLGSVTAVVQATVVCDANFKLYHDSRDRVDSVTCGEETPGSGIFGWLDLYRFRCVQVAWFQPLQTPGQEFEEDVIIPNYATSASICMNGSFADTFQVFLFAEDRLGDILRRATALGCFFQVSPDGLRLDVSLTQTSFDGLVSGGAVTGSLPLHQGKHVDICIEFKATTSTYHVTVNSILDLSIDEFSISPLTLHRLKVNAFKLDQVHVIFPASTDDG